MTTAPSPADALRGFRAGAIALSPADLLEVDRFAAVAAHFLRKAIIRDLAKTFLGIDVPRRSRILCAWQRANAWLDERPGELPFGVTVEAVAPPPMLRPPALGLLVTPPERLVTEEAPRLRECHACRQWRVYPAEFLRYQGAYGDHMAAHKTCNACAEGRAEPSPHGPPPTMCCAYCQEVKPYPEGFRSSRHGHKKAVSRRKCSECQGLGHGEELGDALRAKVEREEASGERTARAGEARPVRGATSGPDPETRAVRQRPTSVAPAAGAGPEGPGVSPAPPKAKERLCRGCTHPEEWHSTGVCYHCGCERFVARTTAAERKAARAAEEHEHVFATCPALSPRGRACGKPGIFDGTYCTLHGQRRERGEEVPLAGAVVHRDLKPDNITRAPEPGPRPTKENEMHFTEQVYEALAKAGKATAAELADTMGADLTKVAGALRTLFAGKRVDRHGGPKGASWEPGTGEATRGDGDAAQKTMADVAKRAAKKSARKANGAGNAKATFVAVHASGPGAVEIALKALQAALVSEHEEKMKAIQTLLGGQR
jgi:hypothetical protein